MLVAFEMAHPVPLCACPLSSMHEPDLYPHLLIASSALVCGMLCPSERVRIELHRQMFLVYWRSQCLYFTGIALLENQTSPPQTIKIWYEIPLSHKGAIFSSGTFGRFHHGHTTAWRAAPASAPRVPARR